MSKMSLEFDIYHIPKNVWSLPNIGNDMIIYYEEHCYEQALSCQ